MRGFISLIFVSTLLPAGMAYAGFATYSSEDFGKDAFSLIVARVKDITFVDNRDATHWITFEPLATIAGDFDPSHDRTIRARLWVEEFTSSVQRAPRRGDIILAAIGPGTLRGEPTWDVLAGMCTFMPKMSACVTVTGADDKIIWETLNRIHDEREKAAKEKKAIAKEEK